MKDDDENPDEETPTEPDETQNEDFQFVLKQLLDAYRPIIEQDLKRAKSPKQLTEEEKQKAPNCEDEIALANQLFESFVTEEIALRLLPAQGRELMGPVDRWRWCLLHIRCCIIFGWLVCRGPRNFRGFTYYLYRYWLCVRQVLGKPVSQPPTDEEREDFKTLVQALASAYKPFLTDQLATIEFPLALTDEVFAGEINCNEGQEEVAAVFERILTLDTAPALLGREVFEEHSKEPFFWFCRCWCLCAIRFGCCLARARNLIDVLRCLIFYWRCIRDCFGRLRCDIIEPEPNACAEEQFFSGPNVLGIEILGTATGAFCSHYTLEWKAAAAPDSAYTSSSIVYPGGGASGTCGVANTTLGYLNTAVAPIPNDVTVRLCVFGTTAASPVCCTVEFEIFRRRVWIRGIEGVLVESPPGPLGPTAQLKTGGQVRSFGTALRIYGRAWVGKCTNREIHRYTLSYQEGFGGLGPWTQFWQVDYLTPLQRKEIQTGNFALTSRWHHDPSFCLEPPLDFICYPKNELLATRWWSGRRVYDQPAPTQSFPIDPEVPATVWTAQQLPLPMNCQSGRYTLRLDVEDTMGNHYYDTQQVWFDNKQIYGEIRQLAGVPPCDSINLSDFAPPGADCSVPWPSDLLGIAYDEFIEEGNASVPSDNYGGYQLWIKKDGAPNPGLPVPIPGPGAPPWGPPFGGGSRVGNPSERCPTASPPAMGVPPATGIPGILASLDMRRLDAVCNPGEPQLTLKRGECCGFNIRLLVWDTSICPSLTNHRHQAEHDFPICICNDLQELE